HSINIDLTGKEPGIVQMVCKAKSTSHFTLYPDGYDNPSHSVSQLGHTSSSYPSPDLSCEYFNQGTLTPNTIHHPTSQDFDDEDPIPEISFSDQEENGSFVGSDNQVQTS
ncbi:hypothetical protein O181_088318, partial [Austropuccinia psidii MF-1]|nr:hypothetical protein [Austropuccinia psidii MF-1]